MSLRARCTLKGGRVALRLNGWNASLSLQGLNEVFSD
jgi:hypothetical protein